MRTRDIQIKLWLNNEEYNVLQQDVRRTGLTQSKYLRMLIMKRPVRERLPIDYYHMLTGLSRIGNNLNQIARRINSTGEHNQTGRLYGEDMGDILQNQEQLWQAANEILGKLSAL